MICWILQIVLFLSTTSNESSRPVSSPNLLFKDGNLKNTSPLGVLLSQPLLHVVHIDDHPGHSLLVQAAHLLAPEEVGDDCCHLKNSFLF